MIKYRTRRKYLERSDGKMLIGIDIGGTSTDGILVHQGIILNSAKCYTDEKNLETSILTVLDALIHDIAKENISRIVLSTTLVTNLLAKKAGEKTALVLIPGPGLNVKQMELFPHTFIINGATDFRGRIIEDLNVEQVEKVGKTIFEKDIRNVAIVGKFSPRNSELEQRTREILLKKYPEFKITLGFQTAGQLNFLRRAATTYYTAMTQGKWESFAESIKKAIMERKINAPLNILKADGGTMSFDISLKNPCETVFSGPAASVMGAIALTMDSETSVVVDIGGTTTDLALILEGRPLYASKGALIEGHYTGIRSFNVRSIALGGDSEIRLSGSQILIGPNRGGLAACFGGPEATPTDAINILENMKLGEMDLSSQALEKIARPLGLSCEKLAKLIINQFLDTLEKNILDMFKAWKEEPAYKVYEVVNKREAKVDKVVGIGGGAEAFIPLIANRLGCSSVVHPYASVANALGAAVSRPTLSLLFHADTRQGHFQINHEGISGKVPDNLNLLGAKEMAKNHLKQLMRKREMVEYFDQYEFFLEEQFNTISDYRTTGKIFDIGIQVISGVINEFKGVEINGK
ncbi:MAG: hydantoinase/oxoprolinase family protein [Peptococcales bacterium]|jgi:N-methylhydantoinase A